MASAREPEPGSGPTPTPQHFVRYRRTIWRLVEAQHRISTNRLASSAQDQALLEDLVEEVKPPLPKAARGLHYLLATPFRYGHLTPSRFRRAGERPGIFYGSEQQETAIAETAYWRLVFLSRSPGFAPPAITVAHTAFTVPIRITRALDLTSALFARNAAQWMHVSDYSACQTLAAQARAIDTQAIRYASVRDPQHRANLALLDPRGFAAREPAFAQTWHFRYEAGRLTAYAAFPSDAIYSFGAADFGIA